MNRVTFFVLVACIAAGVGWIAIHERDESRDIAPAASASASASAAADAAGGAPGDMAGAGGGSVGMGGGLSGIDLDAGMALPEGSAVPALEGAPKSVRFGVVLVQYAGAQGAKEGARSRAEAEKLAAELAEIAQEDFAEAVKKGDPGSVEDAGRMFRGILEPAPEYALFSLDKGAVSAPIDTPRGFWIVKRIE